MEVVVRFAPSPSGYLHIGGARTALFNWLFAHGNAGKMMLRIEDTDEDRSRPEYIKAITDSLEWLGLTYDDQVFYQSQRKSIYLQEANNMLSVGRAYKCYCTAEELQAERELAQNKGVRYRYSGRCRGLTKDKDEPFVVRANLSNGDDVVLRDAIKGEVTVKRGEIDDIIIMRSNGVATYHFAVVVDDHFMGITHVIRGDDHLTNTITQIALYDLLSWDKPVFAHIPLIHGSDGAKLSKRHGDVGVMNYKSKGILAEALNSYLLRLGCSYGTDDVLSVKEAVGLFSLSSIGKSPAKFDFEKLKSLNKIFLARMSADDLLSLLSSDFDVKISAKEKSRVSGFVDFMKTRCATLLELRDAILLVLGDVVVDAESLDAVNSFAFNVLSDVLARLQDCKEWNVQAIKEIINATLEGNESFSKKQVFQSLRVATVGKLQSPDIAEIMCCLQRDECISRIKKLLDGGKLTQ